MPAASRGLRLAGLARFLPAVNLRRHAACEPLDAGAQAPAKERRGGAPPKFAAAARVHGVMGARKQCSGRHSAAARAPAHLGVAVGAAWVVYSVAGRTPWPSSPRAAPHTLPPPPIILAFRGVRAFSNLTVNGDSNPWPPHTTLVLQYWSQWLSLLLNWSVKGSPRASSSRQGGSGNLGTSLLGGSSRYPCDPTNQPPLRQAFDWRFSPAKHAWALSNK